MCGNESEWMINEVGLMKISCLQYDINQIKARCRPSNIRNIPQQQSSRNVL
jgi:hypothetical protein